MRAFFVLFALWLGMALRMNGQEWQSLFDGKTLKGWAITPFGGHGDVVVEDGTVILNQGVLTGIHYTNALPTTNYEIALEAQRALGSDFFCGLTFPVKDSFCTLIVGGWGGGVVGLSSIDYNDAANNDTTKYMKFDLGRWYRIRLQVTETNIATWIDDERVINADIKGKTITLRPGDIEMSKPMGIATWSTTAVLKNIRLKRLDAAVPPKVEPKTEAKPAPKGGADLLGPQLRQDLARIAVASTNTRLAWSRLAELCDRFGPRFSGSTNLELAIDWTLEQMRKDGFDNVRGEPVMVPRWIRGEESVELLQPLTASGAIERLPMLGLGGSVGTPPEGITAEVMVVRTFAELSNRVAEARGKIVLFDAPFTEYGITVRFRVAGASEAAKAGAVASLIRSVGDFSLRTPHTGMMIYSPDVPKIPHAALAPEDSHRLARLAESGQRIVVRLKMSARTESPVESRNIIAEIRGREHPEEIIVLGGHFDSWDVGRGAQDDGGGCLSAWEAMRLIRELGLKPRRTLRCVLWNNEEFGLAGAKAYRDTHASELDRHVVALESDEGTFDPRGFSFVGSDAGMQLIQQIGEVLTANLRAGTIRRGGAQADVGPLLERGVPVLGLNTDRTRYFWYHHTDADTPDKVDALDLARCAGTMATMVYGLAESELRLPR